MPASKTAAREFVDSAFEPKPFFGASPLSVLKGSYLVPKALFQLQPGALPLFAKVNPSCGGLAVRCAVGAKHQLARARDLSKLNAARSILRLQ